MRCKCFTLVGAALLRVVFNFLWILDLNVGGDYLPDKPCLKAPNDYQ